MTAPLDPSSFQPYWLSLPFGVAALALAAMAFYALFINGSRVLRAVYLLVIGCLFPVVASPLVASFIDEPVLDLTIYRLGFALLPTGAVGMLMLQWAMSRDLMRYRWILTAAVIVCMFSSIPALLTDWYLADTRHTTWGLRYFTAGPLLAVPVVLSVGLLGYTAFFLNRQFRDEVDSQRRDQIKWSLLAVAAVVVSLGDLLLAYGIGAYAISWLFLPVGAFLLLRALMIDSLIDSQSADRQAGLVLVYGLVAGVSVWLVWDLFDEPSTVVMVVTTVGVFASLRVLTALFELTRNPASSTAGTPLERLLEQFTSKVQGLHAEQEIGVVTAETLRLALGCDLSGLLLPSAKDYSWVTSSGDTVPEEAQPDPFTFNWLLEHPEPIQRSELPSMRLGDLRKSIETLFAANVADVIAPLVSRDEMVGMLVLGFRKSARPLGRDELEFLDKATEQLAAALVYARMHREVNRRVAAHKEVELAAAVQRAFVPSNEFIDCGSVQLAGLWAPALQCGGDWWSVHRLPDDRVLVLIGDVTGHGVAAAMITAAAKGCYDIAERLMGNDLDLVRLLDLLDSSVRLVGADRLHMTCFATILDPAGGKVHFANAGHAIPYICRRDEDGNVQLGALVARGNPLGSQGDSPHRSLTQDLASGDVLVWYTDGIVECSAPDQKQFGDRRLQRLLRKVDQLDPNPRAVRDHIVRAVAAFQRDQPPDDDITLVVARVV